MGLVICVDVGDGLMLKTDLEAELSGVLREFEGALRLGLLSVSRRIMTFRSHEGMVRKGHSTIY